MDTDSENELLIQPHILHGTGYWEDIMLIADKDKSVAWAVFRLDPRQYAAAFDRHVGARLTDQILTLYRDDIGA